MFQLRKLNSLLVIIIILTITSHALLTGLLLAELIEYTPNTIVTGKILLSFVIVHIIISLYLFIKDKINQRKIRIYPKINKDTIVQAISGIFIIIFIAAHVLSYIYLPAYLPNFSWQITHLTIDTLFFITLFIHLQISIPRLLVSFGFLVEKNDYDKCRKVVRIILIIIFTLLFLSELSYYIL